MARGDRIWPIHQSKDVRELGPIAILVQVINLCPWLSSCTGPESGLLNHLRRQLELGKLALSRLADSWLPLSKDLIDLASVSGYESLVVRDCNAPGGMTAALLVANCSTR